MFDYALTTASLRLSGNMTSSGHVSASAFYGDGSNLSNIGTFPFNGNAVIRTLLLIVGFCDTLVGCWVLSYYSAIVEQLTRILSEFSTNQSKYVWCWHVDTITLHPHNFRTPLHHYPSYTYNTYITHILSIQPTPNPIPDSRTVYQS